MNLKIQLITFANNAKSLGINDEAYKHSLDYIEHHEFGLAFDTLITQLYEYNVAINSAFYNDAIRIAQELSIPETEISYLKELF